MTEDRIARAREALNKSRLKFLSYAHEHDDKANLAFNEHRYADQRSSQAKAKTNRDMATMIDEALASLPDDVSEREMTDDEYAAFVRAWEETERRPLDSGFEDCVRAGFAAAIRKATA